MNRRIETPRIVLLFVTLLALLPPAAIVADSADEPQGKPKAFDFTYEDINPRSATHGKRLALSRLYAERGVVVNFLASWCGYCWKELPELQKMHAADEVAIVGMAADENGDPALVLKLIERSGLTIPILYVPLDDVERMELHYDHAMLPATYLIDSEGAIVQVLEGMVKPDRLKSVIERHLGG